MSTTPLTDVAAPTNRRGFFKRAGLGLGAVAVASNLAACDSDPVVNTGSVALDFSTDNGVLNYAYALEQLEYAYYVQVLQTPFSGMTDAETSVFTDLRAHEGVHRDFLKTALGANAIMDLSVDFSSVDFSSRSSVLTTAITFEDLGIAAYNGAGKILRSADLLAIAGKIVSVEARHASAIRDLILNRVRSGATVGEGGGGLTEVVKDNALDRAFTPNEVLSQADRYIVNSVSVSGL